MIRKLPSFFVFYEINNGKHKLKTKLQLINERRETKVPNRFFGIRDWTLLQAGIQEFKVSRKRDAGLLL